MRLQGRTSMPIAAAHEVIGRGVMLEGDLDGSLLWVLTPRKKARVAIPVTHFKFLQEVGANKAISAPPPSPAPTRDGAVTLAPLVPAQPPPAVRPSPMTGDISLRAPDDTDPPPPAPIPQPTASEGAIAAASATAEDAQQRTARRVNRSKQGPDRTPPAGGPPKVA